MESTNKYTFDFVINELKTKSIHDKYPYSSKKTGGKIINMSLGRIFFNECLPEDYPLINEPVNQTKLNQIIKDLIDKYEPAVLCDCLSNLQEKFFQIGTISPSTFTIDSFIPSQQWLEKKKEFEIKAKNYSPVEFQKEAQELTKELVKDIEDKGFRIHNILKGGIKGNPIDDWKNLLVGKGYIIDIENNLLGPVVHGIAEGFDKKEYFDSIAEARRGFYYKASLTAIPGYLARKITMASANITLADKDCKTKKYYEFLVNKDNIKNITGRYMYHEGKLVLTTLDNLKDYIGKTVKLRSPLYCQSPKGQICPICFGELANKLDTKRIGILAAGVVNLITLNALMKMRHKSSQINATEVDFPKILQETKINLKDLAPILDIKKNEIYAKKPVRIDIDLRDYSENEILETSEYYQIPGILDISLEDDPNVVINLQFSFQVKIFKPSDFYSEGKDLELHYSIGEKIIAQDYVIDQTDPTVIRRLFDAGFKYIKDPESLVENIYKNMTSDLVYIELIVQNMFRSKKNPENNCRLTHYKDCEIYSQKRLPFLNSWINNIAFESINKGIKNGLLSEQDIKYDPIEKIVIERFI